jgi:glycosyltransferase involved in cell wall biosynthesis
MISIITVVRNAEATIENTILSVLNQTFTDYEFIIIDGKSSDKTVEIINKYLNKINVFISESDNGIYDAMNKAIKISNGDWLYFLGSDDIFYNNNVLNDIFTKNKLDLFEIVYGNVITKHGKLIFDGEFNLVKHFNKSVCQQAIFYKKSVFTNQLFETKYITTADYVFNINHLSKNSKSWLYIPNIICIYNETGASFAINDKAYFNNNFILRYQAFKELLAPEDLSRLIYPSYIQYFKSHSLNLSITHLFSFIKRVGIITIFKTIFRGIFNKNG